MAKLKPDFGGMIDLPDDPGPAVKANDHTAVQSYDHTEKTKAKRSKRAVEAESEDEPERVQRSLYATAETFDRIRQFAFEKRRPAQEIYREGLLLVMKKYGIDEGVKLKDV